VRHFFSEVLSSFLVDEMSEVTNMASPTPEYDRKALRDFYYKAVEGTSDLWECKKCHCSKKQAIKSGYENLKSHAVVCFGEDYLEVFLKSIADASTTRGNLRLDSYFNLPNKRERDIYKWIEWVVMRNQPLSEVDNDFEELRLRKKRRCEPQEYIDVGIIQSTSCSIERIFSDSKHILTDQRKNMSPILFEAILYLKKNRSLWSAETVAKALKRKDDRNVELDEDMYYEVEEV
jgi:hypothetical protein